MQNLRIRLRRYKTHTNCFILAFVVLNFFLTAHLFIRQGITNKLVLLLTLSLEVVFEIGIVMLFYYFKKWKLPIEKMFLGFYLVVGLLFILVLPHQQTPDSYAHMTRAYEVSNGVLVAKAAGNGMAGATLPVEIRHFIERENGYDYELAELTTRLSGETYIEQTQYPSASGYIFLLYLPHVVGILIGKLLHLPIYFILLFGRICCMVAFGLMAYLAIKLTPKYKLFFSFIAAMPMTVQQTTSYTADAMTLGVTLLVVSYALYLMSNRARSISWRHIAMIYVSAIGLALCKVVYFPLMGLFILVPWKKFGSKRRKWLHGIVAIAVAVLLEIIWMKLQTTEQGTLPITEQFTFIVQHPAKYVLYMFGTAADYLSTFYISSTFGMSLGAWKFDLPNIYFYLALAMMAVVFVRGTEHFNIGRATRVWCWMIFILVVVAFMTTMFTQWTKPGLNYIDGVQGRYYIPILTLIPMMFSSSRSKKEILTLPAQYSLLFNVFFGMIAVATIVAVNVGRCYV